MKDILYKQTGTCQNEDRNKEMDNNYRKWDKQKVKVSYTSADN